MNTLALRCVLATVLITTATAVTAQTDWNRINQQNDAINRRIEQQRQQQLANEEGHRRSMEAVQRQRDALNPARQPSTGADGPRTERPPTYAHLAVAWHADAGDVWATWNQQTEEAGRQAALVACNRVMGSGCTIALNAWNSSIAVARSQDGFLWTGWGATPDTARRLAIENCAKSTLPCEVTKAFTAVAPVVASLPNPTGNYFPDTVARHYFAMVAWPKEKPAQAWLNKAWLVSGVQGYEASQKQVLDRCKQDTGVVCEIGQSAANGLVVKLRDETGVEYWHTALLAQHVAERVKSECAKVIAPCTVVATYDSRTPRLEVVATAITARQTRGSMAIAWPRSFLPTWQKVVVTTGHPKLDDAKAAAVARCETESRNGCTLLGEVDDGNYPLLGLYRDSKGGVRWYGHFTSDQIDKLANEDCAGLGLSCKRLALVDARKPGTAVQSLADQ